MEQNDAEKDSNLEVEDLIGSKDSGNQEVVQQRNIDDDIKLLTDGVYELANHNSHTDDGIDDMTGNDSEFHINGNGVYIGTGNNANSDSEFGIMKNDADKATKKSADSDIKEHDINNIGDIPENDDEFGIEENDINNAAENSEDSDPFEENDVGSSESDKAFRKNDHGKDENAINYRFGNLEDIRSHAVDQNVDTNALIDKNSNDSINTGQFINDEIDSKFTPGNTPLEMTPPDQLIIGNLKNDIFSLGKNYILIFLAIKQTGVLWENNGKAIPQKY